MRNVVQFDHPMEGKECKEGKKGKKGKVPSLLKIKMHWSQREQRIPYRVKCELRQWHA